MSPKPQIVQANLGFLNFSPIGFHKYASEYLTAARSISPQSSFSPVPFFLYCHSIELVLKAFLLVKGVSKQELKENPLGHNLETLLQRAEKQGLGSLVHISPGQQSELVRANNYYKSKQFEYFDLPMIMEATTGYKKLPDLTLLDQLADTLITGLRSYCLTA